MSDLYHGEYPVDMTPTEARVALAELQAAKPYVPRNRMPPELAERALVIELSTQMALAAGYAPHCWRTWEQEATVIIPTIAKHAAAAIAVARPFIEAQERVRVANWLRETAPQLGHDALADAIEQGITP